MPSEFDREGPAIFRVLINPMVWWMWASGPILVLGTLFALSPRRRPAPAVAPSGTGARHREGLSRVLVLVGILLADHTSGLSYCGPSLSVYAGTSSITTRALPRQTLMRRWDAAVSGLASAELDHGLGNMTDSDYSTVRGQLMSEAASVMREMELTADEEDRMLSALTEEVRSVRARVRPQQEEPEV